MKNMPDRHSLRPESETQYIPACPQSIEGNVNRLTAKLRANFWTDDFHVSNRERSKCIAIFQRSNYRRSGSIDVRKIIEICEHAARVRIAIVEQLHCELLVTITSVHRKGQRIFLREKCNKSGDACGIKIRFVRVTDAIRGVEGF